MLRRHMLSGLLATVIVAGAHWDGTAQTRSGRSGSELANATRPPKVVFVSGEFEYRSKETLPQYIRWLEARYPLETVYLQRTEGDHIPGLEALRDADLAVLYIRRMTLPDAELQVFKDYVASGRPLVGIRTTSHAFENWTAFDKDVLGGNYQNHRGNRLRTTVTLVDGVADHPILQGVQGFVSQGSLYRNNPVDPAVTVLLTGTVEGYPEEPVAWTHEQHGRRVFYTSLGHPKDFEKDSFLTLLVNGLYWALDKKMPVPVVKGPARRVGVEAFERYWNDGAAIVLDIRTPREYAEGHLPGAVNVDYYDDGFRRRLSSLDREQTYLIHCASGGRSGRACALFDELGFERVIEMQPGFRGWSAAGKPVVK